MLDALEADPADLALAGRITDRVEAEADRIADRRARVSIKRCATASAIGGRAQDLRECVRALSEASSP
jgi:hypothetical protein